MNRTRTNTDTTARMRTDRRADPSLRLAPRAWVKLLFLCHRGDSEIGGFGIASEGDPLYITDVALVRQRCAMASVEFDDDAVADFFDERVDDGLRPDRFARIWVHTHPGDCPEPSGRDERTFDESFGGCDWSVMFILARNGATYARLAVRPDGDAPALEQQIRVSVDVEAPDAEAWRCEPDLWRDEYDALVTIEKPVRPAVPIESASDPFDGAWEEGLDEDEAAWLAAFADVEALYDETDEIALDASAALSREEGGDHAQ